MQITPTDCCHTSSLLFSHAGNPKGAKRALFVGLCVSLTWVTTIEVVTLSLKDYIPMIFTSDPTITRAINVHIYIMAVSIFCDALHSYLAGIIVGCGWQHVGAVFNVLWYWGVGAPLGISLTLAVQLGALGYWIGQASAAFLLVCSYIVVVSVINWKKRSEVAQKLAVMHHSQESESSSNKDAEMPMQTTSRDSSEGKENTAADPAQSSATKKVTMAEKPAEPNGDCSKPESDANDKGKKKPTVGWKMVVVRILTAGLFIILCVGAVVISQEFVYNPTPCNATIAGNVSESLPFDGLPNNATHTISTSVPHCTSHYGAVTSVSANHFPSPTPTPKRS